MRKGFLREQWPHPQKAAESAELPFAGRYTKVSSADKAGIYVGRLVPDQLA